MRVSFRDQVGDDNHPCCDRLSLIAAQKTEKQVGCTFLTLRCLYSKSSKSVFVSALYSHDTRNRQARACDALLRVCHSHKLQSAMTTWTRGVSFGKQSEAAGRMLGWLRLKVDVITLRLRA